jgi:hypothetical protein
LNKLLLGGDATGTGFPVMDPFQPNYGGGNFDGVLARFDLTFAADQIRTAQEFASYMGGSLGETLTHAVPVPGAAGLYFVRGDRPGRKCNVH